MTETRVLTGAALTAALPELAALRIAVFREYPYLYDGDKTYEEAYLASYYKSPRAIVVGAYDGDTLIGAATGMPMRDHDDDFGNAFAQTDHDLTHIFYCAESVLLPAYRGRGIGHAFFDARESHARAMGFRYSAFCAVIRPDHHPMKPMGYRPLDPFWRKRGYTPLKDVVARFHWKEVGAAASSPHDLQFWMKPL